MDILIETLHDTWTMIPLLFIIYFLIEYFERKEKDYSQYLFHYGPIFGAILGLVPQCGFSVLASLLFIDGRLSLGTLISVFIATSDEAIPILLTQPHAYNSLIAILVIKFIVAIIAGYLIDIIFKKYHHTPIKTRQTHSHNDSFIKEVLIKTLKIYCLIFITNVILSIIIEWIGADRLSYLLLNNSIFQPLTSAIFGFIPNCSATLILTQLYLSQILSFPSLLAGLITNAGLGIVILLQYKVKLTLVLKICLILLIISLLISLPLQWFYLI
ncbi:MAG: putative manganese transporter [Coprobacillus sp.]